MIESRFKNDCPKVCFASKKIAKKHMKLTNKKAKLGLTDVYYFDKCSAWHTTSAPKEKNRNYTHSKRK